ncbi:MAG: hypothetical protein ABH824_00440 [Nanoarchaeota archaeon]
MKNLKDLTEFNEKFGCIGNIGVVCDKITLDDLKSFIISDRQEVLKMVEEKIEEEIENENKSGAYNRSALKIAYLSEIKQKINNLNL